MLEIGFEIVELEKVKQNNWNLVGGVYRTNYKNGKHINSDLLENLLDQAPIKYTKIKKKDMVTTGLYPVISQEKSLISGYTDIKQGIISKKYLPIISFGDHNKVAKYIDFEFFVGADGTKILKFNNGVAVPKYIYYCINSRLVQDQISTQIPGKYYSRHYKYLKKCKIPLPSLEEQQKIVEELDSYQKIIDGAKQVVDNWKPYFKVKYDEKIVKLKDVILDIKDGGTPLRKLSESYKYFAGDINWCVVKDIQADIYETKEKLTKLGLQNCSAKLWPTDSIIISLGATIGNVGIARKPTATKQGLSGIIVDKTKIEPKYLYYIFQFKRVEIQAMSNGATIKEVRPSKLIEQFTLPLPPIEEQQKIVEQLDNEHKMIESQKEIISYFEAKLHDKQNSIWEQ